MYNFIFINLTINWLINYQEIDFIVHFYVEFTILRFNVGY